MSLPSECGDQIKSWEVVPIDNLDEDFSVECGGHQLFFMLTVDLMIAEKRNYKVDGGFKKLCSSGRKNHRHTVTDEETTSTVIRVD